MQQRLKSTLKGCLVLCSPAISFQYVWLQRSNCIARVTSGTGDKRKITRAGGVTWEGLQDEYDRLKLVRGLSNEAGRNNCFLNVIIQSLWHLRSFREALLAMQPQVGNPYLHCTKVQLMPVYLRRLQFQSASNLFSYDMFCYTIVHLSMDLPTWSVAAL